MAKVKAKFESARDIYPWSIWTNGKAWEVKQGVDFDCSVNGFRCYLYEYARRKELSVRVSQRGNAFEFQFSRQKRSRQSASR
jgi:hypothetical protein